MANPTSAAGDNGVSGATSTTAQRNSVAKTQKGYGEAVADSAINSDTKNLRLLITLLSATVLHGPAPDYFGGLRLPFFYNIYSQIYGLSNFCLAYRIRRC